MNKILKNLVVLVLLLAVKQNLNAQDLFDYGDAPASYEMNARNEYVPARHRISPRMFFGDLIDVEAAPQSVARGEDNNGMNGDGLDEDGITGEPPVLISGSEYRVSVSVVGNASYTSMVYAWIDMNDDGRFSADEFTYVLLDPNSGKQTIELVWPMVINESGAKHLYMRIRVTQTVMKDDINSPEVDERAIGDGFITGVNAGGALLGEVEDYRIPVERLYDYGDAPNSYDMNRDGQFVPARQAFSESLYIGLKYPDVEEMKQDSEDALGDDRTGDNDEGTSFQLSPIYRDGRAYYSIRTEATNNTPQERYLYAWIDFNNNGRFERNELSGIAIPANTTKEKFTITWTLANFPITGNPSHLFMRLRLSEGNLIDFESPDLNGSFVDERAIGDGLPSGVYDVVGRIGEVEDHYIAVFEGVDYGDVPVSYEYNARGAFLPARHLPSPNLRLGNLIDIEASPNSVAAGADNNGENGDGLDEDGITGEPPALMPGRPYSVSVSVMNTLANAAKVHAWIDLNDDGRFSVNEYTSVILPANSGKQTVNLVWPKVTNPSNATHAYMRLRVSASEVGDNPGTTAIDERSLGDGLSEALNAFDPTYGEVEDYIINWTDFCYIPGATEGQSLQSFVGITSLDRAGTIDADQWPKARSGAWLVLESKTKGFVPNRVAFNTSGLPIGIPASNFVEGMLVYDVTNNCLKMYTSKDKGTSYGWYKIESQACPD